MSLLPVLIILHQEHSTPGRVGMRLRARGHALDIRRPRFGDPLPETLACHAGAIVFGGPMSVNDHDDWIRQEADWLAVPLTERAPFLGICLGAQLLVKHLGGTVAPAPCAGTEVGYYPLEPTDTGRALVAWPGHVYQWHTEGFSLPAGTELLARGTGAFPHQAILYGETAFGIQFHPEVTHHMMHRWTTRAAASLALPGAQPRAAHVEGRFVHDAPVRIWLDAFLDMWLARDPRRVSPCNLQRVASPATIDAQDLVPDC